MHFYLLSTKCISPNNFIQDNALRIHTSVMHIYSIALVIMNECSNKLLLHLTENDKMFLFQIRFKIQIQGSRIIIGRNNIKIKLTGFYRLETVSLNYHRIFGLPSVRVCGDFTVDECDLLVFSHWILHSTYLLEFPCVVYAFSAPAYDLLLKLDFLFFSFTSHKKFC